MAVIQLWASFWSTIDSVISTPPTPPTFTTPRRPPTSSSLTNTTLSAPISTRSSSLSSPLADLNTWRWATCWGAEKEWLEKGGGCDEKEVVCVRGPEAADGEDVRTNIRDFHCLESAKRSNEDAGWCFATFEDRCIQGFRAVCVAGNGGNVLAEGVSAPAREPARARVRSGDNERDLDRERDRDLDRSDCACDNENERVWERDDVLSRSSSNTGSNPID